MTFELYSNLKSIYECSCPSDDLNFKLTMCCPSHRLRSSALTIVDVVRNVIIFFSLLFCLVFHLKT